MKKFYTTTKAPITNQPSCYYNFVTTGLYSPDPSETNVKKLIDPIVITGANFPQDIPTRFFVDLPGVPDYSGAFSGTSGRVWVIKTYRPSTATWTTFTLVQQGITLGANQCKIFSEESENCAIIEFHNSSVAEDDMVYLDCYCTNTVLHSAESNTMMKGSSRVVIASSDSSTNSKIQADHLIDTTDDAGAKINAIVTDLATTGGGKIIILEGTYNRATQIELCSNLTIEGNNALFVATANTSFAFHADTMSNIKMKGLKINGVKATYTGGGIWFENCDDCIIEENYIYNTTQNCITFNADCHRNRIINNRCVSSNTLGINDSSVGPNIIEGNICYSHATYGISLDGINKDIVTNNICYSNGKHGIYFNNCDDCTIENNECYDNTEHGIYFNTVANYNTINGNICKGNTLNGIRLNDSDSNIFLANQCYPNTANAIYIDGTSGYNQVHHNKTVADDGASDIVDDTGTASTNDIQANY